VLGKALVGEPVGCKPHRSHNPEVHLQACCGESKQSKGSLGNEEVVGFSDGNPEISGPFFLFTA